MISQDRKQTFFNDFNQASRDFNIQWRSLELQIRRGLIPFYVPQDFYLPRWQKDSENCFNFAMNVPYIYRLQPGAISGIYNAKAKPTYNDFDDFVTKITTSLESDGARSLGLHMNRISQDEMLAALFFKGLIDEDNEELSYDYHWYTVRCVGRHYSWYHKQGSNPAERVKKDRIFTVTASKLYLAFGGYWGLPKTIDCDMKDLSERSMPEIKM